MRNRLIAGFCLLLSSLFMATIAAFHPAPVPALDHPAALNAPVPDADSYVSFPASGLEFIARERQDQAIEVSSLAPDTRLMHAVERYLQAGRLQSYGLSPEKLDTWLSGVMPWPLNEPFIPKDTAAANYAAAGALLAAEIDRLREADTVAAMNSKPEPRGARGEGWEWIPAKAVHVASRE